MIKVLVIGNRVPLPPRDGGALASLQILELYAKAGFQTDFITLNTLKHFVDENKIQEELSFLHSVVTIYKDTSLRPFELLINLFFSNKSYNLERFYSNELEDKIVEKISSTTYDWIHVESLFSAPFLLKLKKSISIPIVIRTHNIEHQIWERLSEESSNPLKKIYLKIMSERLFKEELKLLSLADTLFHIAPTDADFFVKELPKIKHVYLPYAVKPFEGPEDLNVITNSVGFIGSMEWIPNKKGLQWFLDMVWPKVLNELPDALFRIAGKNMGKEFQNKPYKNVEIIGEVEDSQAFMQENKLLVVPLFSGSGIRIKTLEAMSLNIPVVSTSIGAQGINAKNGTDILLADSAKDFASAIVKLLSNESFRKQVVKGGKTYVTNEHSEIKVIETIKKAEL